MLARANAPARSQMRPYPILVFALLVTSCTGRRETQRTQPPPARATTTTAAAPSRGTASVELTNANYEEVVRSQKVVLLLFWAEWSAPDRAMMPTLSVISKEYAGRAVIGKVNVDDNPELASKFGIKGIPTLVVLKDGTEQERVIGLVPKKTINELLDKQRN